MIITHPLKDGRLVVIDEEMHEVRVMDPHNICLDLMDLMQTEIEDEPEEFIMEVYSTSSPEPSYVHIER